MAVHFLGVIVCLASSAAFAQAPPSGLAYELPSGLKLTVKLEAPIVSGSAAVGDRIRARIVSDAKHKKKVIVPAGALLLGRIRWLEKRSNGHLLGIEFTEIQWDTYRATFLGKFLNVIDVSGRIQPF